MSRTTNVVDDGYTIRWYEAGDRSAVESLFALAFSTQLPADDADWFTWRFLDYPFSERVPLLVLEHEGEIVGIEFSGKLPVRIGGDEYAAVLTGDAVIHPDHRRKGLFTRLIRFKTDYYAEREPVFIFANPEHDISLETNRKYVSDELITDLGKWYRIGDPTVFLENRVNRRFAPEIARLVTTVTDRYPRVRGRLAGTRTDFDVYRHADVPADRFEMLYEKRVPPGVHVSRSATYFDRLCSKPVYDYDCYSAWDGSELVAGVVAERDHRGEAVITRIAEAIPFDPNQTEQDAIVHLLSCAHRDGDSAMTIAYEQTTTEGILRASGFFPSTSRLVPFDTTPFVLFAWPTVGGTSHRWYVNGMDLSDERNWSVSRSDATIR